MPIQFKTDCKLKRRGGLKIQPFGAILIESPKNLSIPQGRWIANDQMSYEDSHLDYLFQEQFHADITCAPPPLLAGGKWPHDLEMWAEGLLPPTHAHTLSLDPIFCPTKSLGPRMFMFNARRGARFLRFSDPIDMQFDFNTLL